MAKQALEHVRTGNGLAARSRERMVRVGVLLAAFAILLVGVSGCQTRYDELDLTIYRYRDTRNLVKFVYDASLILSERGVDGLAYFRDNRARFRSAEFYLYIYDMTGTNLFHAGMPELEGRDLRELTDKDGKQIFSLVLSALEDPKNPHAWVHYSWWEPGRFYPVPKSSCHFKVETSEGIQLIVGGGLDYPHEEQEFVRIVVDDAAELIERRGPEALRDLSDPTLEYTYRDVRVFVFRRDGEMLISPAVNSTFSQANLLECVDEVGQRPFVQAMGELESAQSVWEVFMAKELYERRLIRKCLYVRKATMAQEEVYVTAITDLPEPPY